MHIFKTGAVHGEGKLFGHIALIKNICAFINHYQ